jgi:Fe-S-cluster containining protein
VAERDTLRQHWFELYARVYEQTRAGESELPCLAHCPDGICERDEKVFFLPFEIEFVSERTGLDLVGTGAFWVVDIPDVGDDGRMGSVPIGLKDSHRRCPFFTQDCQCAIHDHRPVDCRSFPLIPSFYRDGSVGSVLRGYCPLVSGTDRLKAPGLPDGFVELYRELWEFLSPNVPVSWKYLYWHSREFAEINDPDEEPRFLSLDRRLAHIRPEMLPIKG